MTVDRSTRLPGLLLGFILAVCPASAQTPALQYNGPVGFTPGRGGVDPQVFVDPMLEGSVEVYGFRAFQGDFRTAFMRTLFAERMSPPFNNPVLLTRPVPQAVTVPGADDAVMVSFTATQNFYTYIHTRLAILARGSVAVVDARARSAQRMQANLPAISAMFQSLQVIQGANADRAAPRAPERSAPLQPDRGPGDPLTAQARAVQRLDAFVDHFRRTGEFQSRLQELAQIDAELSASNQTLAARSDWAALATGLTKQGSVHRMQGDWANAVALYRQAALAAERGGSASRQADALAWGALAESSRSNRNLAQAATDATRAVRLAESSGDNDVLARALDVLGTIQLAQSDLAGANDTFNREVSVAEKAPDRIAPFYAYLNRSDVFLKTAERCDFQRTFDACYQALDRAGADLQRAAAIATGLGYTGLARQADGFIKNLDQRRALIKSQERMHSTVTETAVFRPKSGKDVLVTERFVAAPGPIPPQLTALTQESRRMEQALAGFAETSEARSQYVDGLMNEMQGRHDAALALFLKSIDTLERDRRALRDDRSRGTIIEDRIGFYYAAIQQLLERRRFDEAFEVFERARSRALSDLLASRTLGLERAQEQQLFTELMVLRTKIADAQSRMFELAGDADRGNNAQLPAIHQQIRSLEAQHDALTARIAVEAPRLQTLVASKPATLKAFQQLLRSEQSEALQYLVLEHAVLLWHITPSGVTVKNVFLPRTEVMRKVDALRKSLSDKSAAFDETTSRELFLYLIAPVLPQVRADRLIVLPHEDLHYIPFQALQDPSDRRYLGERFQISYAPSASVFLQLQRSPGLANGRLLAVADPGIPAATEEVTAIAKLFPARSRVLTSPLARERDVKTAIADYDVVHLSVHGKFDAAEPLLSYLELGRGGGDDGKLTAAEMFGLPLAKNRLVVLSACETGRAEATHANEVIGIERALLYAGAPALVLSQWQVDAEATARWMQAFYEAGHTQALPDAARTALKAIKAMPQYRHPHYWAAFTMIGR
jgi:CHAT domain-containing protein